MKNKFNWLSSGGRISAYIENTSWLMFEKLLRLSVGIFISIWVARYLGAEEFGLLSYSLSFVALFAALASVGLNSILVRDLVELKYPEGHLLGTAVILKLCGAMIAFAALAILAPVASNDDDTTFLILIIASAMFFQSFNVIDFYFQSQVLSRYVVFTNSAVVFASSALKVVFILKNLPLEYFALVSVFDSIITAVGYIFFFVSHNKRLSSWSFDFKIAKSLLADSWPLILTGLVVSLYMKIDQVMIHMMLDPASVGNYAAAVRISEAWYMIPTVLSASLFPAIINAKKISDELYYSRLQALFDFLVLMALVIAIPFSLFSDTLVVALYGLEFYEAAGVLTLHIWSGVFVFLGVASSRWFIAENLQKYTFYRTLSGAVINLLLNLWLIPGYGIQGAAAATLIAQLMASYLFNIVSKETRIIFLMHSRALLFFVRILRQRRWNL